MGFLDIANSNFVWLVCGVNVALIVLILFYAMAVSMKQAKALGIEKSEIILTIKTTLVTSIGPALSILVPFIAMTQVLGTAWSWIRLSVIGSASMELTTADLALTAYGGLMGKSLPAEGFALVALNVAVCVSPIVIATALLNKPYSLAIEKARKKDAGIVNVAVQALSCGLLICMITKTATNGCLGGNMVPLAVALTTFVISFIFEKLVARFKLEKLKEYSMGLIMLASMASAIFWANVL